MASDMKGLFSKLNKKVGKVGLFGILIAAVTTLGNITYNVYNDSKPETEPPKVLYGAGAQVAFYTIDDVGYVLIDLEKSRLSGINIYLGQERSIYYYDIAGDAMSVADESTSPEPDGDVEPDIESID